MEAPDLTKIAKQLLDEATKLIVESFPELKLLVIETIEYVFVPRAIARQVALAILLETGAVTLNQILHLVQKLYCNFSSRSRLIRQLETKQQDALTQDAWMDLAEQIDNIQENDIWRTEPSCPLYEADRISSRIDEFMHLMRRRDVFDLMFTLRGGIARNTFGLLHEGLFSKAMAGTKMLVETYHNIVCASLDFVCDSQPLPGEEMIPTEAKLAFFNETRHMYGRTALMLSGGAALGHYHVGVVKALMSNGLLPRVLSGASAGSVLCAMIGTRTDEECQDLYSFKGTNSPGHSGKLIIEFFRPIGAVAAGIPKRETSNELQEVLQNTAGAFKDGKRTWQLFFPIPIRTFTSTLYDILTGHKRAQDVLMNDTEYFRQCCRDNVGDFTFQEAFDRTGRILNITVSPKNRSDPPRLLNYLTAPHVLVWSAAVASASLPGVFEANSLLVKDADGTERSESATIASFIDGSMEQDLPMQQLSEMFNINHFIVSQANPHAVFLTSFGMSKIGKNIWNNRVMNLLSGVLLFLKNQAKCWIGNIVEMIGGQRIAPMWDTRRGFGKQFFTQEYEGRDIDVSLIPWINHRSLFSALLHCIYNPSREEWLEWVSAAERETWRYIPKIKSHVAVEMTLDKCVQRLRKRIVVESIDTKGIMNKERMNNRVPSFFTSASLVNMSGLGVTDRYSIGELELDEKSTCSDDRPNTGQGREFPVGWGGLGLRGNHSTGSLNRSTSGGSGLFLMDHEVEDEAYTASRYSMQQEAGEHPSHNGTRDEAGTTVEFGGYMKTTSMADFYYKRSHGSSLGALSTAAASVAADEENEVQSTAPKPLTPTSPSNTTDTTIHHANC